jgi:hypothetical protein
MTCFAFLKQYFARHEFPLKILAKFLRVFSGEEVTRTYVEFAAIFSDPNYIKYYTFLTRYRPFNFLTFKAQEIISYKIVHLLLQINYKNSFE